MLCWGATVPAAQLSVFHFFVTLWAWHLFHASRRLYPWFYGPTSSVRSCLGHINLQGLRPSCERKKIPGATFSNRTFLEKVMLNNDSFCVNPGGLKTPPASCCVRVKWSTQTDSIRPCRTSFLRQAFRTPETMALFLVPQLSRQFELRGTELIFSFSKTLAIHILSSSPELSTSMAPRPA